jgi:alkanesulfonate monooxygenase SsuD/methylene tetrahydromethanopterin reductase-like flavin-dependent oxidoreductase (luciferase family)
MLYADAVDRMRIEQDDSRARLIDSHRARIAGVTTSAQRRIDLRTFSWARLPEAEQISLADELGYDFFSTTESFGKDEISCSPFPLGLYVAAAQRARRIRFLTGIIGVGLPL